MKHSPTPWTLVYNSPFTYVKDAENNAVFGVAGGSEDVRTKHINDARHIIACVNTFDAYTENELSAMRTQLSMAAEAILQREELVRQRDELLSFIEKIKNEYLIHDQGGIECRLCIDGTKCDCGIDDKIQEIDAFISKYKQQQP